MCPARLPRVVVALALMVLSSAASTASDENLHVPALTQIPSGVFIMGSDRQEREYAYRLDEEAYGHSVTREQRWYESEGPRREAETSSYAIATNLITNRQYAAFVEATGHLAPNVDRQTWEGYGLIHPYDRTRRHAWLGEQAPAGRLDHPVVLVNHRDAQAYAAWLSEVTGRAWRLPTEKEWEKAARGADGRYFPWGDVWDETKLNSHDAGPFDTLPVGSFPDGKSPFGLLDPAGQVFEWTSTPGSAKDRFIVKGGSWDDKGCGVCRPAARHSRPAYLKHILVGFRLVAE